VALAKVAEVGGRPIWAGDVRSILIGPPSERWDQAVLVEYPSRSAFQHVIAMPDYQAGVVHRTAALEDSRLVATVARSLPAGVSTAS
jgi:uncharacterized protein (DUF1330 family)